MTSRVPAALVAAFVALSPPPASACSTAGTGARCVSVPQAPTTVEVAAVVEAPAPPPVAVGAMLDRGRHSILMNADYYGLPPVADGWVYMRVGRELYRVDWRSHEVLERVTHLAAANF